MNSGFRGEGGGGGESAREIEKEKVATSTL